MINRLEHGVGYTIHEAPDIKQSNKETLKKGMAFSIEPGVYFAGDPLIFCIMEVVWLSTFCLYWYAIVKKKIWRKNK